MERLVLVRCLALTAEDESGDVMRCFLRAIEAARVYCPWITPVAPGTFTLPARGPARFFGGEAEVVRLVDAAVAAIEGVGPSQVGIADGLFAAYLAAQVGTVVPQGMTQTFLSPWPVTTLERPELEELLCRLGMRTLGAFGELPERHVSARLGADGALCHRVARALEGELPGLRQLGFGRRLEQLTRTSRSVVQVGFWGGRQRADLRAAEVLADVQRLLGPEAVLVARRQGGRSPGEQVRFVTWDGQGPMGSAPVVEPWPGRLPSPAPALVHGEPQRVELVGEDDRPVSVTAAGVLSYPLDRLSIDHGEWSEVVAWSGPWPVWERWWSAAQRKSVRLQVVTASGLAYLLSAQRGSWWLSATYD
jgi:nucleotidyltransferase/DNA polymerase involved in DNA repair